jgi:acetyl esterase/lipase
MFVIAYLLSFLCLILNLFLFVHLKPPYSVFLLLFQILAMVFSPVLAVLGLLGAGLGWMYHVPIVVIAGLLGTGISVVYIALVTIPQPSFDLAFGRDWKTKIPPSRESHMLKRRWNMGLPRTGKPIWERDVAFWTIPCDPSRGNGRERSLLCDVWQPPENVARSGLALIYLHGGNWYLFDKDYGTRSFFRHLANQGHVIMDVAYRLCPEVDIYGMIEDVKRAIAWIKANASRYEVTPERIVLVGGSAGGHLALLAAYTPDVSAFTPQDLQDRDLSVRAVVSYYGPTDLRACYKHLQEERMIGMPKAEIGLPASGEIKKNFADAGRLDILLGGHLHETPEIYDLASPVTYVRPDCPPTLLIQGTPDIIAPITATIELHRRLTECGVPAINIVYPLTNHAFDILPEVSPPGQAALYYMERFLALMV